MPKRSVDWYWGYFEAVAKEHDFPDSVKTAFFETVKELFAHELPENSFAGLVDKPPHIIFGKEPTIGNP